MIIFTHPLTCSGLSSLAQWDSSITEGKPKGLFLMHGNELQEESFRPSFKFSGDNKSHKICKRNIIKSNENYKIFGWG